MLVYPRCGSSSSSTGCASPRLDWTGSRERASGLEPSSSIPRLLRERASERTSWAERSRLSSRATSWRVQNAKASRGALEESQPLSYHTLGLRQAACQPWLRSPLLFFFFFFVAAAAAAFVSSILTFLRKSTDRPTDQRKGRLLLLSFATSLCSGQRDSPRLIVTAFLDRDNREKKLRRSRVRFKDQM